MNGKIFDALPFANSSGKSHDSLKKLDLQIGDPFQASQQCVVDEDLLNSP